MALKKMIVPVSGGGTQDLVVEEVGGALTTASAAAAPLQAALQAIPVVLGRETLTVSTSSVGLASIASGATEALITVEDADVRYWEDGSTTAPTGTTGLLFISGSTDLFNNLAALRFIRKSTATVDAKLNVSYRKYGG